MKKTTFLSHYQKTLTNEGNGLILNLHSILLFGGQPSYERRHCGGTYMNSAAHVFSGEDIFDHLDPDRITLNQIVNDTFISKNTNFDSVEDMVEKSGFRVNDLVDFNGVQIDRIDEFVKNNSRFGSWEELLHKAAEDSSDAGKEDQAVSL